MGQVHVDLSGLDIFMLSVWYTLFGTVLWPGLFIETQFTRHRVVTMGLCRSDWRTACRRLVLCHEG